MILFFYILCGKQWQWGRCTILHCLLGITFEMWHLLLLIYFYGLSDCGRLRTIASVKNNVMSNLVPTVVFCFGLLYIKKHAHCHCAYTTEEAWQNQRWPHHFVAKIFLHRSYFESHSSLDDTVFKFCIQSLMNVNLIFVNTILCYPTKYTLIIYCHTDDRPEYATYLLATR